MTVQMVTVTWDETDIGGAGLTGSIRFVLSQALSNTATGQRYEPDARSYPVSSGTGQTVPIVPNDSSDLTPSGTFYTVTIAIAGQAPEVLYKFVNSASGATQSLASLPNAVPLAVAPLALPLPLNSPPTAGQVPVAIGDGSDNTLWGSGGGGGGGISSLAAADTSVVVTGGTGPAATVRTNTLDVIATQHPPAANWSNNSHKITSLANGSAAQDAAAFGQIPTSLPPNGAAGGVLSGTYPNPGYAVTPLPQSGGTMTGALAPAVATLTFVGSGTTPVNAALGNVFALTLTASTTTLGNPSNPVDGQAIRVRLIQDGTGSRTIAYGTAWDFGTAGAPTLSTGANKVDVLGFEYVASLSKWCYLGSGLGF